MNRSRTRAAPLVLCAALLGAGGMAEARVTRIVIDETLPLPGAPEAGSIAYEQVAGRAFGELDPKLPGNALIQDIELAADPDGKVRYVASFVIYKPVDAEQTSKVLR
jgi:hypothetical protein